MQIANTVHDSIVDGPGLRFTVFTQGCVHNCPGCHNPDTHPMEGGQTIPWETVAEDLKRNPLTEGLTLSGGEPFLQGEDCAKLAAAAHEKGMNVWVYTGYRFEDLLQGGDAAHLALLHQTDVLVDGRFIQEQRAYELLFRGSRNQRLIDVPKSLAAGKAIRWQEKGNSLDHFTVPQS